MTVENELLLFAFLRVTALGLTLGNDWFFEVNATDEVNFLLSAEEAPAAKLNCNGAGDEVDFPLFWGSELPGAEDTVLPLIGTGLACVTTPPMVVNALVSLLI